MIGRTTTREFPLTFTNNLTSATMPSQPFSRASPSEGLSTARQVMADAVTFYLEHGGPAEARLHVEKVANELKFYDDIAEAYREALERIRVAEEAERQRADERKEQELHDLMKMMMSTISPGQKRQQPSPGKAGQDGADTGEVVLPPKLNSPKARRMWQRLQQEGYIDDHYQPVGLSRTDVALLAEEMTIRLADENENLLDIKEWKPYETLWRRNNMKADHQRARVQEKTPEFRDKLKELFKDI